MCSGRTFSLIKFAPDKNLAIALGAAVLSVMASALMSLTESEAFRVILRQFVQVIGIGLLLPFFILYHNREFHKAAIRFGRPFRYIAISMVLAIILFFQMVMEIGIENIRVTRLTQIEGAFYVMVTNVVEVIFFACFIRHYTEKSLGVIPAIIITAAFFSLHHAGFQPEYIKLFIVGLIFITIIRIANHWLIAFPFWWIGGIFDVMFGSEATASVDWRGFTIYSVIILAIIILITAVGLSIARLRWSTRSFDDLNRELEYLVSELVEKETSVRSCVLSVIRGESLYMVYQDLIFRPLGLKHTWLIGYSEPQIAQSAAPADVFYKDKNITKTRSNGAYWADGGIVSTAEEMIVFLKALNEGRIISGDTLKLMHNWHKLQFPLQYGYGTMYFKLPWLIKRFEGSGSWPERVAKLSSTISMRLFSATKTYTMAKTVR